MPTPIPTRIPTHLTDSQLVDAVARCARGERDATVLLVAHLAEMDARQLHLAAGFSSLFAYCREVLRLSESATCKRIDVARAARQYPVILDLLAEGALSLSTARLIAPHLTEENHRELIASAAGRGQRAVQDLVARWFPRPDVAPLVRRLPAPAPRSAAIEERLATSETSNPAALVPPPPSGEPIADAAPSVTLPPAHPPRPLAMPLSADRYQIRFTASAATWEKLQVARDLLWHAVPNGDPSEIFDRALTALIEDLARKKCANVSRPDAKARATSPRSRHIPAKVRRAVWARDGGRCAFVSGSGKRCSERGRVEFHHVEPYGVGGAASVANIQLRCRSHNAYEAVLFYGEKALAGRSMKGAVHSLSARHSTGRAAGNLVRRAVSDPRKMLPLKVANPLRQGSAT